MITIKFGWWLLPFAVTLISVITAYLSQLKTGRELSGAVGAFINLFHWLISLTVSLLSWLIWAIVI